MSHCNIVNGICYKNEDESNKLRMMGGAWSINLDEIRGKEVEGFVFKTSEATYKISMVDAAAHGLEKFFAGERKLVVPLKYWSKDATDSESSSRK